MKSLRAIRQGRGSDASTSSCRSDDSSWIALRVRGPDHPTVFDGPVWAHTSPVYVEVAGQRIASRQDAEYFVDWIEQMLRVVAARNRYASVENRRQVEMLFRRAQDEFRKLAGAN